MVSNNCQAEIERVKLALRTACELEVEAVRAHWPADKPLFMRLSVEDEAGLGPAEHIRLARAAKPLGVDVIDCSTGGLNAKVPNFHRLNQYGFQVPLAHDNDGKQYLFGSKKITNCLLSNKCIT